MTSNMARKAKTITVAAIGILSMGWLVVGAAPSAQAEPPRHAPAYGYRAKRDNDRKWDKKDDKKYHKDDRRDNNDRKDRDRSDRDRNDRDRRRGDNNDRNRIGFTNRDGRNHR